MAGSRHQGEPNLTVAGAARLLGVHPNTVRAWSDQGILPYLRINERGDRRYRPADLQRFLDERRDGAPERRPAPHAAPRPAPAVLPIGPDVVEERTRPQGAGPGYARFVRIAGGDAPVRPVGAQEPAVPDQADWEGMERRRPTPEVAILTTLVALVRPDVPPLDLVGAAVDLLHDRAGHDLVAIMDLGAETLSTRVARGVGANRLDGMPATRGLPAEALAAGEAVAELVPPPHVDEWLAPGRLLHGRIVAPITGPGGAVWGLLVVGDEGSAAIMGWRPVIGAIAQLLSLSFRFAGQGRSGREP